jgi:hypothetical protein
MTAVEQTLATEDVRPCGLAVTAGCARPRAHFVRMFKPRFAALVEAGTKTQTVRPTPKRMPRVGDTISLRVWTGAPYRSKQRVLREAVIEKVERIVIGAHGALPVCVIPMSDDVLNYWPNAETFAQRDGFASWPEMREWFEAEHGLPFEGIVIFWHNTKTCHGPEAKP